MVSRDRILERLRRGDTYEQVGAELGIPAGQAYLVATGIPADGSDSLTPAEMDREGFRRSTQSLLGVPAHNPNEAADKPQVMEWVRRRASAELRPTDDDEQEA